MKHRGRSPAPTARTPREDGGHPRGGSAGRIGQDQETPNVLLTSASQEDSLSAAAGTPPSHALGSTSLHVSPSHHRQAAHSDLSPASLAAPSSLNSSSVPGLASTPVGDNVSLGNSIFYDNTDGASAAKLTDNQKHMLQQLEAKMQKTRHKIKQEQNNQDLNVNEYLKLSSNASNSQQATRIKEMFEKKNQKSASLIGQFQKKLDEYEKRKRDLEYSAELSSKGQKVRDGIKHVGGNIITMSSQVMLKKPKELANRIIRGGASHIYGSADNLSSLSNSDSNHTNSQSASLPRDSVGSGGRNSLMSGTDVRKCLSEDGRRHRSTPSESDAASDSIPSPSLPATSSLPPSSLPAQPPLAQVSSGSNLTAAATGSPQRTGEYGATEWNMIMQELTLHKEEVEGLREGMDELRQQFKQEIDALSYQLREETERSSRLGEELNELMELHQNEIAFIKNEVNDQAEIALYQSEERLRDIKESLKMLDTKMTNMEIQQVQQQYLHIEGLNSTDARALLMKLLTAAITVVHIIFFVAGMLVNLVTPFVRTTPRIFFTSLMVAMLGTYYYQKEYILAIFHKMKRANLAGKS